MTLLQIECFVEAAKAGNISKAAAKLFLSQQSASKHVKTLETELGFPLFERHNLGVRLTPSGEILLSVWEKALSEHRIALDKAKDVFYGNQKAIHIGLLDCGGFNNTMIECITVFNEKFPELTVEYEFLPVEELFDGLEKGKLHMVFLYETELRENHSFHLLNVCSQPIRAGIYLSRKHPLANRKFDIRLFQGETFGVLDEQVSKDYKKKTHWYLSQQNMADSVQYKYFRARHNLGIALVTQKCVTIVYETMYEHLKDKLKFIPIPELQDIGMVDLIWKDEVYSTKARSLAEIFLNPS